MNNINHQLNTPVCLIVFNRPDTARRVFDAIRQVRPPKLLVIADAPRPDRSGEAERCAETLAVIDSVDWDCEVLINLSDKNMGARKRLASGLKWLFDIVEDAIILEHDCLPHPSFFRYCEELLEYYRHNERIVMISGNNNQLGGIKSAYSYYFSRYNHIWGWASWRRAFRGYDESMAQWPQLRESGFLTRVFNNLAAIDYWTDRFDKTYQGLIDTWDYQMTLGGWVRDELVVLPNVNLVANIGFGEGAANTTDTSLWFSDLPVGEMQFPLRHPETIERHVLADDFEERTGFSGMCTGEWCSLVFDRLVQQGVELLNNNYNREGLNLIQKAINIHPMVPDLHCAKAMALGRLGYVAEAVEALRKTLGLDPNHPRARDLLPQLENM